MAETFAKVGYKGSSQNFESVRLRAADVYGSNGKTLEEYVLNNSAYVKFGVTNTATGTAEKIVDSPDFVLGVSQRILVLFNFTNSAVNPKLNVNNTGAKPIYYRNAPITPEFLAANKIYEFVYNGSQYVMIGDVTEFAAQTEVTAGTVSNKVIAPNTLKFELDKKVNKNNNITAATRTKITYDTKGLVTDGADLALSDLPRSDTANRLLKTASANNAPVWSLADLTTDVTGILPVANGGTGVATVSGASTTQRKVFVSPRSTTAAAPSFDTLNSGDVGLGNVDNTSDANKPVSTEQQTALDGKVDKVEGKQLSANDYTSVEKSKLSGIEDGANKYTHPTTAGNKHIPSGGSSGQVLKYSADGTAVWGTDNDTTYSTATTSTAGLMSATDKTKLDGITTGANNYTHPTTSGNKHIPSGGESGQILRWSADGTATWGTDNNTTYSAMSVSEGQTATATTSRVMRADYLKQIIKYHMAPANIGEAAVFQQNMIPEYTLAVGSEKLSDIFPNTFSTTDTPIIVRVYHNSTDLNEKARAGLPSDGTSSTQRWIIICWGSGSNEQTMLASGEDLQSNNLIFYKNIQSAGDIDDSTGWIGIRGSGTTTGRTPILGENASTTNNRLVAFNADGRIKPAITAGSATLPVYLNNGVPTALTQANLKTAVEIDSKQNKIISVTCETAAATAAKAITISDYTLTAGDIFAVTYTLGNTANSATISVNESSAIQVRLGGGQPTGASGTGGHYVAANNTVLYYYNGTYMCLLGSQDITDSSYSTMSVSEGQTATATTGRVMRADYLKQIIDYHITKSDGSGAVKISSY